MTRQELFDVLKGDLHVYDLHKELLALNTPIYGPILDSENEEYRRSLLRSHALILQHYLDISYPNLESHCEYEVNIQVRRRQQND